jgi:hypothetical protein
MAKVVTRDIKKRARSGIPAVSRFHEMQENVGAYISPRELAIRWRCSRSTVDRIAERVCLTRLCLGDGPNGIIRYLLKEVEGYEQSRMLSR